MKGSSLKSIIVSTIMNPTGLVLLLRKQLKH